MTPVISVLVLLVVILIPVRRRRRHQVQAAQVEKPRLNVPSAPLKPRLAVRIQPAGAGRAWHVHSARRRAPAPAVTTSRAAAGSVI